MLISGTVQKLQQCKYAGGGVIYPPPVASLLRPNSVAGQRVEQQEVRARCVENYIVF